MEIVVAFVGAFVTPVVDALLVPVKNHLNNFIFYTKHVNKMHTKMVELNASRSDIKDHEEKNRCNSHKVPTRVPGWLEEVENIDTQVKTIPVDVSGCLNLKVRHKLGREVVKIIQNIDRLIEENSRIDWTEIPIPPAEVNSTKASTSTPFSDYNDFESRKSVYMEAFNALKADNKPHMIALCGMGGVGKTTMMEKLHKAVREKEQGGIWFNLVIKITIGARRDVSEYIQTAVAEQLAIDLKETTKEARVDKLRNAFEGRSKDDKNKFLVILDDLWESVDLKDIGLSPKPDQGIDFKVLLTSRDRKLCIQMGVEHDSILNLEVIKDSEAQDFFFQFAKISDDGDLRNIGRDITIRCHGLPIAIKTIACALYGESKHVWEDILSKLEHKGSGEVVGKIFKISYEHLHDEDTRLTLLLCGLFPEDFDTPTEDLVRYSFGLKLFKNVDSIREARNRLNTCIERLIHANLLIQSQEVGWVKMHDLVLGFVLDVLSTDEHSSIVGKWPAEPMREYCKMISLTCSGMHEFPRDLKYPKLSLLKLMHGEESLRFPEDFYEGMEQLEVIAYDRMYPLHLRSLECSSNLRTLCLHECSLLSDCSSIGNLSNLEVLSLAYSSIHKLPSTMVKLNKLKLLDLTGCEYLCIDDGILKSLVKLEELYMRGVGRQVNVEELAECSENLGALEIEFSDKDALPQNLSFKNLDRFRISLGCRLDRIYGVSRYSFENTLKLVINECELLDSGINELFEKTKVLYLHVNGIRDLGDGLGASFHNLRVLRIHECTDLRYLFTTGVANGLKQLEHLEIDQCSVLETLVDVNGINDLGDGLGDLFHNLRVLHISKCTNLRYLFTIGMANGLKQLEHLKIHKCPVLETLVDVNGINDLGDGLGDLFHNLRVLHISECTKLRYLFTIGMANGLKQLEHLKVAKCPVLETLVDSDEICEVDQVITLPSLKFLSLEWLPMLTSLCKNGNVIELPQMEELELRGLTSFTSIYQHFLKKEGMNSRLKKLKISFMEKLKEIWPSQLSNNDQVISQLRVIEVSFCHSLVNLFPSNPMSLLHHLEKLEVRVCGSIDVIFNIDLGSSSSCVIGEIKEDHSSNLRSIEVRECGDLTQIWRVKGVNNDLPILGFQAVEYIDIKFCKSLRNVFTPTTSNFDMKALTKIILYDWEENKRKEVEEINGVAFPSHLIHTCRYLHTLDIRYFKRAEVAFEIETPNSRKLTATLNNQQQQPLLPHLKDLELEGMERMTHVWKYDRNQFLISQQEPISSSFLNLTSITLDSCNSMKYLFSPLMAKLLSNLNSITIKGCRAIEEVVSNIDDEYEEIATSISSHTNTTFFPHLEILDLSRLKSLKRIDGVGFQCSKLGVAYSSFCRYLKTINIDACDALLNVIPSHAVGEMSKLEELKISDCKSLREIFEIEGIIIEDVVGDITDIGEGGSSDTGSAMTKVSRLTNMTNSLELPSLKVLHIYECHGLKYIFTSSTLELPNLRELHIYGCHGLNYIFTSSTLELPNLRELHIEECHGLKCIFTSSTLELPNLRELHIKECHGLKYILTSGSSTVESLKKLQELTIENCSAIQVIVKQEDNNGLIIASSKDVMVFPRLKSLTLVRLPNLKGFFLGKSKFQWPLLDKVEMYGCPQMMIFTSGVSEAPKLKYIHTGVGKHSLECGLNFDWANSLQHEEHIQLYNSRMCSTLEYLQFPWSFSNLIEVDVGLFDELSLEKTIFPRIEEAVVDKVEFEGTNDETQSNKKPQLLMTSMDHPPTSSSCIWKINPSNLSNLTKLSLAGCGKLEHVFSYGMAASLVQLQDLHVSWCSKMEVIVEAVQDYSETNKAKKVVPFPCLKSLQLRNLIKLKGFYLGSDEAFQWPSLDTLNITGCPEMTVFTKGQSTTPKLKVIETGFGWCEVKEDLNSFIMTKIQEGLHF